MTASLALVLTAAAGLLLVGAGPAAAAQAPVALGTTGSFAVLAGSSVSNTGPSVINGDLGVSPGTAVTGFPPGLVNGVTHSADAVAAQAQADLVTAYNDAAGRASTATVSADLASQTLVPGVYTGGALALNGTLTLDAQGDPGAVFVLRAASTLITGSGSVVALVNGADACNVFWQVTSSATLGTSSVFAGNVLALTSITADTGAVVSGRLLARNGAVTLDRTTVTRSTCATATVAPTATATVAPTASPTATSTPTTTPSATASATPTVSATASPSSTTTIAVTTAAGPTGGGTSGGGSPQLPRTGTDALAISTAGVLAIGLGGGLVLLSRRARRPRRQV
ncbi:MAG: DUF3494 domain-containing protein [Rhodoferax sp.]|nr:DUF3494 domain-containing protein [Actinomycetota bacterium]